MDLRLEERDLLHLLSHSEADVDTFHFHDPPREDAVEQVRAATSAPFAPLNEAHRDAVMPIEEVERLTIARMRQTGHPHILGSECDVLHVPESAETIRRKVDAMLTCQREPSLSGIL